MPLGPVFQFERTITARKGRFYVLRFVYGLALLALLASSFRDAFGGRLDGWIVSISQVTGFARALFQSLLLLQAAMVVLLTPALVAGAIAGEIQRKTLHDLLASDLTSREIVLGKLGARMLHVAVLVATGLPILVLTGQLGGYEPWVLAGAVAATLSTGFFLGALSILASTQTRSVRGALNFTYTLALTWLIMPGAIDVLMPRAAMPGIRLYEWVGPINAWVAPSSPFALYVDVLRGSIRDDVALAGRFAWMFGLQCAYGSALAALAVVCLRPTYRSREGGKRRAVASGSRSVSRAPRVRPECGDDPMLWKELLAPHHPAFYLPLAMLTALALGGLLVWTTADFAIPAFRELWVCGYGAAPSGSARALFHFYLRIAGTGLYLVFALGVASDAAAGLTSEHEKDTWISLVSTPLTGAEIIRAKILGAIWGIRHTALLLTGLWFLGVVAGSVHPLGLVATVVELAVFTWFIAALGTWVSLRSRNTMRALAKAMSCLLVLNGAYLLVAFSIFGGRPLACVGSTPLILAASLVSYGDLGGEAAQSALGRFSDSAFGALWSQHGAEMAAGCLLSVLAYGLAAWALTRAACRQFDAQLDRPPVAAPSAEDRPAVSQSLAPHVRMRRSERARDRVG